MPKVNDPHVHQGELVIAGPDLERGIRQAMAREQVPSITALAKRSGVRRDTLYGWFGKDTVRVSPGSIDKLVHALGAEPGDPWYDQPTERSLDPETLAMLEAAVDRAFGRLADRLLAFLDARSGPPGAS